MFACITQPDVGYMPVWRPIYLGLPGRWPPLYKIIVCEHIEKTWSGWVSDVGGPETHLKWAIVWW